MIGARWFLSHRADPRALPIADRHYNRQKPGTPQFVPPGSCLVLLTQAADALWVTSYPFAEYVKHAWAGAWMCSCFRNESTYLSSDLIREAVAITRWFYGPAPAPHGFVSFIDPIEVTPKPAWAYGRCYQKAGWKLLEEKTKGGLYVVQLKPEKINDSCFPLTRSR